MYTPQLVGRDDVAARIDVGDEGRWLGRRRRHRHPLLPGCSARSITAVANLVAATGIKGIERLEADRLPCLGVSARDRFGLRGAVGAHRKDLQGALAPGGIAH